MNKPNNYDATKGSGSFVPVELGGHHIVIKQVSEKQSSTGKNMVVVLFDFAKNDRQPDYMKNDFDSDTRADKKWPRSGTEYIVVEDKDGNCSKKFKGFITSFEKSNKCEAVWGEKFTAQFKNKKIGGVFGEVENEYNGNVTMRHELRYFCSDDAVEGAKIPNPQYLNGNSPSSTANPAPAENNNGFMNIPEDAEDEIPF